MDLSSWKCSEEGEDCPIGREVKNHGFSGIRKALFGNGKNDNLESIVVLCWNKKSMLYWSLFLISEHEEMARS